MSHDNCLFCKIIAGEIPSAKVYEDDEVYAFLDISQVTTGHTLIIPKQHVENIYETNEDIAAATFSRVPKVANAIKKAFKPQGMNLLNNNGEFASQSVFHIHIHLIPRYDEMDGFDLKWEARNDAFNEEDLAKIAADIKKEL